MDAWDGKSFIEELKLSKRKSVLEIGIGTGRIAVKVIRFLFKRKKNEQIMISRINEIISSSSYQLVLYKKDYKHFGNCIIKFVCSGKTNIEIITDRHEIIFDNKTYQMSSLGDVTKADKDTLIFKFLEIIFNIVKSNDWRLTDQESYLLFAKLKEMITQFNAEPVKSNV